MVAKKVSKKKVVSKKKSSSKRLLDNKKEKVLSTTDKKNFPSLNLKTEADIATDFAEKVYKKFNKIVKSVVLFGSSVKQSATSGSDIDIVIVIDDASIVWDSELIAWYREELEKIIQSNPYNQTLHVNTIKLTIWWRDLMRGDPLVMNILRYGEPIIDFAGFFIPLKALLLKGQIKPTNEAVYNCLQRAPQHLTRSRLAELGAIEGLYWAFVDASQAALISQKVTPPSPEHIPEELKETFVDSGKLKSKYVDWFRDLHILHKDITHRKINDLKGVQIDDWQDKTQEYISVMANLVKQSIEG